MCTPQDLARLTQLVLNGGKWEGKQLISEDYIKAAISKKSDTSLMGYSIELQNGYGYQIWRLRNNGFAFFGIFSQIAAGFPDNGLALITTGDTADIYPGDTCIMNVMERFYQHVLPSISDQPLPENQAALDELKALSVMPQMAAQGTVSSAVAAHVSQQSYALYPNKAGWLNLRFTFDGNKGKLVYTNRRGEKEISFGLGYNEQFVFTDYIRQFGSESTDIETQGSAAWIDERTLAVYLYFTDEDVAFMRLNAVFDKDRITLLIKPTEHPVAEDYSGYMYGYEEGGK